MMLPTVVKALARLGVLGLVLAAGVIVFYFVLRPHPPVVGCAGLASKPGTPTAAYSTDGLGWQGKWGTAPVFLPRDAVTTFTWSESFNSISGVDTDKAATHTMIFRLEGNRDVKLISITGGGGVSYDGHSAYSCTSSIAIVVKAAYGNDASVGRLWAIEPAGKSGSKADFEVAPP